jgi:predicted Fe-Mo cluster-binding NifX family protein
MKIAISCSGQTVDDLLDPRFGRAEYFLIVDLNSNAVRAAQNPASSYGGGAGIAAAQAIVKERVKALITGQLGPNALNVLRDAGIDLYQGDGGTAASNIEAFRQGKLPRISQSGPSNAGRGPGLQGNRL